MPPPTNSDATAMPRWRTLWGSMSFRLSVLYGVLALVSMLALLAFVSLQVMGALNTHLSRQIGSSMQRLLVEYEDGGMEHLRAAIELTLSDRIDSEREI